MAPILLGAGLIVVAVIVLTPSSSPVSEEGHTTSTQNEEPSSPSSPIEVGGSADSEFDQKQSPVERDITVDEQLTQEPVGREITVDEGVVQTSAAESAPPVPMMRLRYGDQSYDGILGSGCWPKQEPDGSVNTLCWDTELLDSPDTIRVAAGGTLTVEIGAHEPPLKLSALLFKSLNESPIQITLTPTRPAQFNANFPVGIYIIHISGQWSAGEFYRAFKIDVG